MNQLLKVLNEENCASIIEEHFKNNEVFICTITMGDKCKSCKETRKNIETFLEQYPLTKLHFYTIDHRTDNLFSEYYQLYEMIEYPRIILFYGSKDKVGFLEGAISFEHFVDIHEKHGTN
jgi:hypothetical protein